MSVLAKTLNFFGYGSDAATVPSAPAGTQRSGATVRQLTPRSTRSRGYNDVTEIATLAPRSYEDAISIAERFRENIPVIVNMGEMSEADCRRLLDFMAGLKEGLEGHISRVTQKVFLLSPTGVNIDAEEEAAPAAAGDDLVIRPFN